MANEAGAHRRAIGDPASRGSRSTRHAALLADVRARAFVVSAEALGKLDPGKDPDAWEHQATSLLEMAGQIDLTIPDDEAALEAALAHATPSRSRQRPGSGTSRSARCAYAPRGN